MLDTFTVDAATALLGTKFRVTGEGGVAVEMTLEDAVPFETRPRRSQRQPAGVARRKAFSIYFVGPPQPILPQAMYRFESDKLTFDQLFIVPIGADDKGTEYEAVFT